MTSPHSKLAMARGAVARAALAVAARSLCLAGVLLTPLLGAASPPPLASLPTLQVTPYMGTWYQVAWFPNRFQKQCVSDTRAAYRLLDDGRVEVLNRCTLADGRGDEALGIARPTGRIEGDLLKPAQLEVSFLPAALRWLPFGWGRYWVIDLAPDGRYALVSEPSREYLWVLARQPRLTPEDHAAIRATLRRLGFDLGRLEAHPHTGH